MKIIRFDEIIQVPDWLLLRVSLVLAPPLVRSLKLRSPDPVFQSRNLARIFYVPGCFPVERALTEWDPLIEEKSEELGQFVKRTMAARYPPIDRLNVHYVGQFTLHFYRNGELDLNDFTHRPHTTTGWPRWRDHE